MQELLNCWLPWKPLRPQAKRDLPGQYSEKVVASRSTMSTIEKNFVLAGLAHDSNTIVTIVAIQGK